MNTTIEQQHIDVDNILTMWKKDSVIDITELGIASLKTAELHGKYLKYLCDAQQRLSTLTRRLKKLKKLKTMYFNGTLSQETQKQLQWEKFNLKVLKSDLSMHVDADTDVQELEKMIDNEQLIVTACNSIIRMLNDRNYTIKNTIDWEKFKNGM